jgi:hypothetical protein
METKEKKTLTNEQLTESVKCIFLRIEDFNSMLLKKGVEHPEEFYGSLSRINLHKRIKSLEEASSTRYWISYALLILAGIFALINCIVLYMSIQQL